MPERDCRPKCREARHETSPPKFFASGRGRCRAAGGLADREGAKLSGAAGAHHRAVRSSRFDRHRRASDGSMVVGAARAAIFFCQTTRRGGAKQDQVPPPRARGGGNIGTEAVVGAPADRYTLLMVGGWNAINATLYDKLSFNFIRDIAPVAGINREPYVIAVHPSFPAKSVPEFIAYAKANPG